MNNRLIEKMKWAIQEKKSINLSCEDCTEIRDDMLFLAESTNKLKDLCKELATTQVELIKNQKEITERLEKSIKLEYDYNALVTLIDEKSPDNTIKYFLDAMGWECEDLLYRIVNAKEWSQDEIKKACQILEISPAEITKYFYTLKG